MLYFIPKHPNLKTDIMRLSLRKWAKSNFVFRISLIVTVGDGKRTVYRIIL